MKDFNEFFETNLDEKYLDEELEKKYKKFYKIMFFVFISTLLIFLAIFISIKDAKAMQTTTFFYDFNTNEFTNTYSTTLFDKLEELKEYIDEKNIHNRDYVITLNDTTLKVGLALEKRNEPNSYSLDYFIATYIPLHDGNYYDLRYRVEGKGNYNITSVEISTTDFINGNTTTFYNSLNTKLTNGTTGDQVILYLYKNISKTDSWYQTRNYNIYVYDYMPFIYYTSKPIYFNNYNETFLQTQTIQEICSINNSSWSGVLQIYNDENLSRELSCGDVFPTYNNATIEESWTPIYNGEELKKGISSFDVYFTQDEKFKVKLILQQDNTYITANDLTTRNFYGKKCNNDTCYWEKLPQSYEYNNMLIYSGTTNPNQDGFEYIISYDLDIQDYEIIKMSLIFSNNLLNNLNNYNLRFESAKETTLYTDMNYIGAQYNREKFDVYKNYLSILVQNKDTTQNLDYYIWSKAFNNWTINDNHTITGLNWLYPSAYKYTINTGTIEENSYIVLVTENVYNNENIAMGRITLTSNNALYMGMSYIDSETLTSYWVYFTTDVYYTKSNNLTFNTDYNNIQTTITTIQAPNNVREEYSNAYNVNLSEIEEIIKSYYQSKEEWLQLFYSIYDPMPEILKHILIIAYTMGLGYGIFLIFKD